MGDEPVSTSAAPTEDVVNQAIALATAMKAKMAPPEVTDPATRPVFTDPADADGAGITGDSERVFKKGFLPHELNDGERVAAAPYINQYPRGDIDNFSLARACLADYKCKVGMQGGGVWDKFAPWEKAYIEAGRKHQYIDPVTKATMGDMTSGQDGGYLAPEELC